MHYSEENTDKDAIPLKNLCWNSSNQSRPPYDQHQQQAAVSGSSADDALALSKGTMGAMKTAAEPFALLEALPSSISGLTKHVEDTFLAYCGNMQYARLGGIGQKTMSGAAFTRLCRDCGLISGNFNRAMADNVFAKVKWRVRNANHLSILQMPNMI